MNTTENLPEYPGVDGTGLIIGRKVLKYWIDCVRQACDSIYISTYKFTSISALKALSEAVERGLTVKMVLDGNAALDNLSQAREAIRSGVDVEFWPTRSEGKLHAKLSIFDRKCAVIGSFNLTESAEKRNTEVFHRLDEEQNVMEALELWTSIYSTAFNSGEFVTI